MSPSRARISGFFLGILVSAAATALLVVKVGRDVSVTIEDTLGALLVLSAMAVGAAGFVAAFKLSMEGGSTSLLGQSMLVGLAVIFVPDAVYGLLMLVGAGGD